MKFIVVRTGGSIGTKYDAKLRGVMVKEFDDKEEAKEFAKSRRKMLSPGEKKYYGMRYSVRTVK